MKNKDDINPEGLFGFVKRTNNYVVGRDNLSRTKRKLKFLLVTTDISENSLNKMKNEFNEIPIVQYYTSEDLENHFQVQKTKIIGFKKSPISDGVYKALKDWRLNG